MPLKDFKRIAALAFSKEDLSGVDTEVLHGCALKEFKPCVAPIRACAKMIRECCLLFSGDIDSLELDNMRHIFQKKVQIID